MKNFAGKNRRKKAFADIMLIVLLVAVVLIALPFLRSFMNDRASNVGSQSSAITSISNKALDSADTPSTAGDSSDWID